MPLQVFLFRFCLIVIRITILYPSLKWSNFSWSNKVKSLAQVSSPHISVTSTFAILKATLSNTRYFRMLLKGPHHFITYFCTSTYWLCLLTLVNHDASLYFSRHSWSLPSLLKCQFWIQVWFKVLSLNFKSLVHF